MKKHVCMLWFLSVLFSCSKQPSIDDILFDMNERLVDFTDIQNAIDASSTSLNAPSKQSLRINVDDMFINLREFYALDECQLTKSIAQRNTAMGKVQLPSVRFEYERTLLTDLENCARQLGDTHRMYENLLGWREAKRNNLPLVYANLVTQSDEVYNTFSIAGDFISGTESDGFSASKLALNALVNAKDNTELQMAEFEEHLRTLDKTRLLAKMWRTQQFFTAMLPQISQLLMEYQNVNTCTYNTDRENLKIMQNIFKVFFVEKVQPLASELNKYHYQLSPLVLQLAEKPAMPEAFAEYLSFHSTEAHDEYKTAMSEHVKQWQAVFAICDNQ